MRGYGQFCPVARACEVFAARWTPLILRELLAGSRRFAELHRGIPLMSRALLVRRLAELEAAGVVRSVPRRGGRGREYHLTAAGEEFRQVIEQLGAWGQRWARAALGPGNLDAGLLMWSLRRRMSAARLPSRRTVIRFEFRGAPRGSRGGGPFWLVLQSPDVDLCLKDPGFDVDVEVTADLAAFTRVWLGDIRLADARRAGLVAVNGPPELVRAFPTWLGLSPSPRCRGPRLRPRATEGHGGDHRRACRPHPSLAAWPGARSAARACIASPARPALSRRSPPASTPATSARRRGPCRPQAP